ncbi:TerB family tellurite resistance protein [Dankookia sp. P2]|uniref:tellurite resistance TerB family protein n=1 Tax=Dankookia sp. P2 TaxID=3423955 RepID=UPI003D6682FD
MFGMFKSQSASLDLNPRTCLVVSLIYCMGADGEMDEEEIGHLVSVLGRGATREQMNAALRYVRATEPYQFLTDSNARLRPAQKLCIILNMIDSAMSDGEAEQGEQRLVVQSRRGMGRLSGGAGAAFPHAGRQE